ncbi:MAG: DUF3048 domain-containing protein [Clostridia bacterium]|jgi:predicted small lipoprotein YifL|nr:DUF3048 domain-containing protein [Clostridia bacterium]
MKRIFFLMLILILILSLLGCGGEKEPEQLSPPAEVEPALETPAPEAEPAVVGTILNPLTGEMVERTITLLAVMINNAPQARPQTGLAAADLVYEIEMEGNITRFVAFYHGDPPENVGPVRSARPYVMMLAKEWDAYFAHVGGSDDAFAKVKEWGIKDIDDVRGHPGFWLDSSRKRPHNTYLNLEKALSGKKESGNLSRWEFQEPTPILPDYEKISLSYDKSNRPSYHFHREEGLYLRYINDKPHQDRETGEQIKVRNVIIQYAVHQSLQNKHGHIDVRLTGEGKAEYFLGGKHFTGSWHKKDLNSPTVFLDEEGKAIQPVQGKTWIQVVRKGKEPILE